MRFIVDFKRYPTAVCVMVIEYMRGDGMVIIETPCDNGYLQWLYQHDFSDKLPSWWLRWSSTRQWLVETYGTELAT